MITYLQYTSIECPFRSLLVHTFRIDPAIHQIPLEILLTNQINPTTGKSLLD